MVGISDIEDQESLKAWLEDQPRAVAVWIASRAAARVLPLWWEVVLTDDRARKADLTALPVLRKVLISSVAAVVPTDDIRSAAAYAPDAPDVTATAAAIAATAAAAAAATATATATAATAATYAAYAYAEAVAPDVTAVWGAIRTDAERAAGGDIPDAWPLWPEGRGPLARQWDEVGARVDKAADERDWRFWLEWYDSLLDGRPMLGDAARTWEMLEKIALIDPETWDKGPEVVNPVIREIWEGYRDGASGAAADTQPVSQAAKSAMKERVAVNRDALAVAAAGLLNQLGTFKDHVRGMNHLDPDVREEVLAFIDEFTGRLSALLEGLPPPGKSVDDDQAGRLVLWLREYRGFLRDKLAHYGSVENIAEATVPTAIILGSTAIGAMLGMPVAGSVVGGLIVNQMKPGQAARELMKTSGNDDNAP